MYDSRIFGKNIWIHRKLSVYAVMQMSLKEVEFLKGWIYNTTHQLKTNNYKELLNVLSDCDHYHITAYTIKALRN